MTAVEWLISELKKYDSAGLKDQSNYVIEMPTHILTELEEHAKEMEKQQIINFTNDFINKHTFGDYDGIVQKNKSVEEYYNEKFNK